MTDLTGFNPNSISNPNHNIFGLPFSEDDARLVILPVPWEVTVSYGGGTARAADHIFKSSLQVDLIDVDGNAGWKQQRVLLKLSNYLLSE